MKRGYIRIYRSISDSAFSSKSSERLGFWINLLLLANHAPSDFYIGNNKISLMPGQFCTGRLKLSEITGVSVMKCERWLSCLENEQQIAQQKTTKYRIITILNWNTYQSYEQQMNNKRTTDEQQMNTNNNDNNDKKLITKVIKDKVRDEIVDFILDEFRKRYNFSPIDKKPRQVAYNISQLTRSFIKKYGIAYEQKKGEKPDVKMIIKRVFDKYAENEYSQNTQYLDTFKRHLKKILEITGNKLITNS